MGRGRTGTGRVARVAIVLDRSGSMEECRDATISGFNEYIAGIRETAGREEIPTRVTLTTFNGEVSVHHVDALLGRLEPLSRDSYIPNGSTAMLDAVGETIGRLQHAGTGVAATQLVCVISDGYENASRRYTYADLAERIQQLTASGSWTFTYLGSNQDLSKVARDLHIPAGNTAAYASTPDGTDSAWRTHAASSSRYLLRPAPGDFYGEKGVDTGDEGSREDGGDWL